MGGGGVEKEVGWRKSNKVDVIRGAIGGCGVDGDE